MRYPPLLRSALTTLLVGLAPALPAAAYDLPAVNLGFTSFLDGGPPAGPGLYATQYFQYYQADEFTDDDGRKLRLPTARGFKSHDLDVYISLTQFIYQSTLAAPLGGKWGLDVIVPAVHFNVAPGDSFALQENQAGLGDLLIGPYVQWDPVMGEKGPRFMQRVELQLIFPTGKYDERHELNPGSNHFYFNPYWSGTLFHSPKWTSSVRLHYLWNYKNHDPSLRVRGAIQSVRPDLRVGDIQPGQAIHANVATAWEVMPGRLRVGLNGYFLRQITDTEVDGNDLSDRREQVAALGPGLVYHFSKDAHLFFNLFFETGVKNRPRGKRSNLRLVYHF